ncbi:MAG: pentapeptide repeat-containing protein [Pseudomonadota bacterium]
MQTTIAAALLFASSAYAVCTDAPRPVVNWNYCVMEQRRDLSGQKLDNAGIRQTRLIMVNMERADLRKVNFEGANLGFGRFVKANAQAANFTNATLYGADFTDADLREATFDKVDMATVRLKGADLTGAKWSDGRVCGPISIGVCR